MRFDELLPMLISGRRCRRAEWRGQKYLAIIPGEENITCHDSPSYYTWPSRQYESKDLLAEDWEVIPQLLRDPYVREDLVAAMDAITSDIPRKLGPTERPVEDLVLAAITSLVRIRAAESPEQRLEDIRSGAAHAFMALATALSTRPRRD